MRQFVFTAILLFGTLMSYGQHWIKGKVLDENGHPLVGADVYLKKEEIGKTTDKDGTFLFENLKNRNDVLKVSYLGYETRWIETTLDKEITVQMSRTSFEIGEITVTSLRANERSAVAYSEVKKEEIESRNLGQDIPFLLAGTPSFIVLDAGNGAGYPFESVVLMQSYQITLNGVPLNDAESGCFRHFPICFDNSSVKFSVVSGHQPMERVLLVQVSICRPKEPHLNRMPI